MEAENNNPQTTNDYNQGTYTDNRGNFRGRGRGRGGYRKNVNRISL